jgi:hypothetical protein
MTPQPETEHHDATIQRISSRIVYQNPWMQLREDVIQRPDGSEGIYSYVDKPDFALIIPVEQAGFHLVEQYRYPVAHRSWEFPQGTLPNRQDADPAELARRELAEETGLRPGCIRRLGYLHPAKGMSSQACAYSLPNNSKPVNTHGNMKSRTCASTGSPEPTWKP